MTAVLIACAIVTGAALEADVRAVAALPGDPAIVSGAAVTPDDETILTLENAGAFDIASTKRRLVIINGSSSDGSASAVLAAVRAFKLHASPTARREWIVSALPASAATIDPAALLRWVTFQAPDLILSIGGEVPAMRDGLKTVPYQYLGPTVLTNVRPGVLPRELASILSTPVGRSTLHDEMIARVRRDPLDVARVLAARYPAAPGMSYIPAVSWVNALKVASIDGDQALRARVLEQLKPWLQDGRKPFGDRIQLTAVAGTMVFADLDAKELALEGARLASAEKSPGVAQHGAGWTDDMFMTAAVLSRTGTWDGRAQDFDVLGRLLVAYAGSLQRADGLFNHAVDGPAAWGRGNGFAAMGLAAALMRMPAAHPDRAAILAIYRRQMAALKAQQAPDGAWRNVLDEPGAYREETATGMLMTAMARGVRLGWLDASYRPVVDRAWRALAAHVVSDGTIVDVCESTGGGTTRRYYLDRKAATGADDRGGAMALMAAMERYELTRR